jgi:hypothetical protein
MRFIFPKESLVVHVRHHIGGDAQTLGGGNPSAEEEARSLPFCLLKDCRGGQPWYVQAGIAPP